MCKKLKSLAKAHIGNRSNGNTIIQGSELHNPVFVSNPTDLIKTLGDLGQYEALEKYALDAMSMVAKVHPLYPDFSAKPNGDMSRLISTPETEDAFQKYPKRIKGTFLIDYTKYPHMDKSETPWEYAYRTQTKVELQTTAYKEYLGDIVDPFPNTRYADGMITIIGAPPFPPARVATIVSGVVSIPIMLRRKPSMEYGTMLFGTETTTQGFDINLTAYKDFAKTDVRITKVPGCDLEAQLLRERLINEIRCTKSFKIYVGSAVLATASFTDDDLSADMFAVAPRMIEYLENLVTIQEHTGCKFDVSIGDVSLDDFRTAYILSSSLNDKWHRIKMIYDDDVYCHYSNIPDGISEEADAPTDRIIEGKVLRIVLQGQEFTADRYIIIYRDAKIDNIDEILKKRKKRKKKISIIFRPASGNEYFYKFCKFEGIHVVNK